MARELGISGLNFFFDNNVPINLAWGLTELEVGSSPVKIVHCRDRWPPDGAIDDVDWIPLIAREERIILTFDKRILKNSLERKAFQDARATIIVPDNFFYKKNYCDQVVWLVRRWPKIKSWANGKKGPGAFKIQQRGRIVPA